jgi:heme/copper-type cytochrome/quinol oxidase subunit 3
MLTGLHGFHVIVGTLFLAVALYRLAEHHFTITNHIGYESAA